MLLAGVFRGSIWKSQRHSELLRSPKSLQTTCWQPRSRCITRGRHHCTSPSILEDRKFCRRPNVALEQALKAAAKSGHGPAWGSGRSDQKIIANSNSWLEEASVDLWNTLCRQNQGRANYQPGHQRRLEQVQSRLVADWIEHRSDDRLHDSEERPGVVSDGESYNGRHPMDEVSGSLLKCLGTSSHDVRSWAQVLTARQCLASVRLLIKGQQHEASPVGSEVKQCPAHVYLLFLRRDHIGASMLRLLLQHGPHRVSSTSGFQANPPYIHRSKRNTADMDRFDDAFTRISKFIMAYQCYAFLIRHALCTWPHCLEFLVADFTRSAIDIGATHDTLHRKLLTSVCNAMLSHLADPAAVEPVRSSIYQEAAQARLLEFMASQQPTVKINADGYRGVIKVQLARPKTDTEREWANLKALSWPPWKHDRTGMDAHIGPQHGISRAGHVLDRMREAGYPASQWEAVARIYTGWDTDTSPTIQARQVMLEFQEAEGKYHIWAGRIRTTRTIQEAWACFLAYEDSGVAAHQEVYLAMLDKLRQDHRRLQAGKEEQTRTGNLTNPEPNQRTILPGDGREISAPPSSSHQETYTRTPPPTFESLWRSMLRKGIKPSGRVLALVVKSASSIEHGLHRLKSAKHGQRWINALVRKGPSDGIEESSLPVFAAFITLLSRFHTSPFIKFERRHSKRSPLEELVPDAKAPAGHSFRLIQNCRVIYRPAINAFFRTLTYGRNYELIDRARNPRRIGGYKNLEPSFNCLSACQMAREVVSRMKSQDILPDQQGFALLCMIDQNAAGVAQEVIDRFEASESLLDDDEERVLYRQAKNDLNCDSQLETLFYELTGSQAPGAGTTSQATLPREEQTGSDVELPRLSEHPKLATLHAYVRALGATDQYAAILRLFRWLRAYWPEVSESMREDRQQTTMFRRVLRAARMSLQFGHESSDAANVSRQNVEMEVDIPDYAAPEDIVNEVVDIVRSMEEEWGNWPDAQELDKYIHIGLWHSRVEQETQSVDSE